LHRPKGPNLAQKTRFQKSIQFLLPQHLSNQAVRDSLVLTEKRGLFWGVLAAKPMFLETKNEFAFVFWRFFEIFCAASCCKAAINIHSDPLKKIIPKSLR
jgi:hypothetical protein